MTKYDFQGTEGELHFRSPSIYFIILTHNKSTYNQLKRQKEIFYKSQCPLMNKIHTLGIEEDVLNLINYIYRKHTSILLNRENNVCHPLTL
jgi:hypothetical protein